MDDGMDAAAPETHAGAAPLDPSAPRQVGDFKVLAQLGIGGMGTVYLGEAPDGSSVAIKLVHPHLASDREFRDRFVQEVRAGQRVPASCTARYIDSGTYQGRPYLVSEYIDGVPVSDLVAAEGPMDEATLQSLAVGVATCLAGIHQVGLVHRDVKPGNVLMALAGVRIIDFGIARAMDATTQHTRTGMVMASLGWAAPEQLNGDPASPAMDVFSWGALVAYAATGRHPFGGPDVASRVARIMHGEPDLTGVPPSLRPLVASSLQRDPGERPTAGQLLRRLAGIGAATGGFPSPRDVRARRAAGRGRGVSAAGGPAAEVAGTGWRRRRRVVAFAAGVPAAALLVIGAASGMWSDRPGNPSGNGPGVGSTAAPTGGDPAGSAPGGSSAGPPAGGQGGQQQVGAIFGPPGARGVPGADGEPGADGADGAPGAAGQPGPAGAGNSNVTPAPAPAPSVDADAPLPTPGPITVTTPDDEQPEPAKEPKPPKAPKPIKTKKAK
ncbi:MAG TPA: serine/threonine-protein kinase [Micromonosporaceae bacterium]|nr:serine/threonine-protein kinase [Micromonosporaceae bacterium]